MAMAACSHLKTIGSLKHPQRQECEECVKIGDRWVHLRTCQECGVTLCCDSSPIGTPANTRAPVGIRSSPLRSRASAGCTVILTMPLRNIRFEAPKERISGAERDEGCLFHAIAPGEDPLEGERKFPKDADHILDDIVALIAKVLEV